MLLATMAVGCGSVNTRTADGRPIRMSRSEFAQYAERTFRDHNRVVNQLITAISLGDDALTQEDSLLRAEEDMAMKCQPLNEMVSATIEGRELTMWSEMLLLNQVPECAAATRRVEGVMPGAF